MSFNYQPKMKVLTFICNRCHKFTNYLKPWWFFLLQRSLYTFSSESNSAPNWWFINQLSVLQIKSTFIEKQTSIPIRAIICQSDRFYSNLSLSFFLKQMIYWSWQDLSSYQYQCDCQAVFVLPKVEWVGISVWIGKLVFQKVQQYSSFSWDRR